MGGGWISDCLLWSHIALRVCEVWRLFSPQMQIGNLWPSHIKLNTIVSLGKDKQNKKVDQKRELGRL